MPDESQNNSPPGLFEYYSAEVTNFHLSHGDSTTSTGRAAQEGHDAAETASGENTTPVRTAINAAGTAVSAAGTALGLFGEVMSFTHQMSEAALIPLMAKIGIPGIAVLPASSHLDPVMGIDVHFVMIPPSPSPIPMPHPYIAMVMDPKDWLSCAVMSVAALAAPTPTVLPDDATEDEVAAAGVADAAAMIAFAAASIALGMAGLGATVKLGGFTPRTVSGVKNKVIPHFPMGASFAPLPVLKNSGHAQFGSLFLSADGLPFTGLMHLNNNCWDVGIMQLLRREYPSEPMHLFMPTGFIMAIPSHNVIINPVPTPINPIAALTKLLNAGFGKLLHGLVRRLPLGSRLSNALHRAICFVTGHPVDLASGMLFTDEEDFSLPGVIPFAWERAWYSDSIYKGPLGHGWHHEYDISFTIENDLGIFRTNDGKVIGFELPEPGKFTFDRSSKLFLHCHKEDKYYYISDKDGLMYRFIEKIYFNEYNKVNCQLLQSISNANGYVIRFEYNDRAQLVKITDSAGRILTVENDNAGRITAIHAPHPVETDTNFIISKYEYDTDGNMICHTDALGQKMRYEYRNHLLVKETWRDGMNWYFEYDGNQTGAKCIHTWGDGNIYNHKLIYHSGVTIVENSLGRFTTYYIKDGLVYRKTDGNGAEWQYRHNKHHELEWETDPLGNQQSYTHDEWGNVATETDPAGGFMHTEYYNFQFPSLPTEAMDKAGGKWKWKYDQQGNLIERIDPLGAKTKYSYDDGLLAEIINPLGALTKLKFDKAQNLIEIKTDDGAATRYGYDLLGNCTEVINPNEKKQERFYDLKGRVNRVIDFDENDISLNYDGIDNVIQYRDKQKDVRYEYRGLWKLTRRSEAGVSIYFEYDTEEQLRKVINEHNLPYTFDLDAVGNVIRETGFDGIVRRYERNPAGWVTQVNRPGNKFTKYGYDAAGRVTTVKYSDNKTESYAYRTDGDLITAVNESATVLLERDVMGNIIKENINDEWIVSEYDIIGNRIKTTSSLGADISQQFNKMGDVLLMNANGWQAKFEHDKLGLEIERHLPGNVISKWQRDEIGRPVGHTIWHTTQADLMTRRNRKYKWDVNDRLKQIIDSKGITKFEHDKWSNLAITIYPNGEEQFRNPDEVGNLFKTPNRNDRVYAKGGQVKKANGWNYSYDEEGNLVEKKHVSGDTWKYEWNEAGMLTKVTRPDKAEVTFTYDALGRRLSKRFKNTVTKFTWDGNVPLHEWKEHALTGEKLSDIKIGENGITTWIFNTDSFAPAAKIKGDKSYSIVSDHLGTPCQMFKDDGTLFWNCELDSYGKVRVEKGELGSCPFRYQGQYEDAETGLYYNRFRYYAFEEGIYLSQDPIGTDGSSYNLYSYVFDPSIQFDLFGLDISENQEEGAARENRREGELRQQYPNADVQREQYLRDENGRRARDTGFTNEARRVDMVVIENGRIVHIEEVTSRTANKSRQERKTRRIRANGPIFIRDRKTKKLIRLNRKTKISTYRMK